MRTVLLVLLTACTTDPVGGDMPDADPAHAHDVGMCGDGWELEILGVKMRPGSCELACHEPPQINQKTCHITPEDVGENNVAENVFNYGGLWGRCDSWNDRDGVRFQECLDEPR